MQLYWFHVLDSANGSGAGQTCMDGDKRAHVAKCIVFQVPHRSRLIAALIPVGDNRLSAVCVG